MPGCLQRQTVLAAQRLEALGLTWDSEVDGRCSPAYRDPLLPGAACLAEPGRTTGTDGLGSAPPRAGEESLLPAAVPRGERAEGHRRHPRGGTPGHRARRGLSPARLVEEH